MKYTDKQNKQIEKFEKKHDKCKNDKALYRYSYIETDTGIGPIDEIRCNYCGKVQNITDVDVW
jgi:hypothetical protein